MAQFTNIKQCAMKIIMPEIFHCQNLASMHIKICDNICPFSGQNGDPKRVLSLSTKLAERVINLYAKLTLSAVFFPK